MATRILTLLIVTQAGIFTSGRSTNPYGTASPRLERFPTASFEARSFGSLLIPDHYRR